MDMGILKIVPFKEIITQFEKRGRREYLNIDLLAETIREQGLINPITVRSLTGEAPYILLAGGRRYKACELLKLSHVSVRIYTQDLDEKGLRAIELYENTKREDLSWPEQVAMTREFNDLFVELKGEKVARTPTASGHSQRDTAKVLGKSQGKVNQDIRMSEAIKKYPELQLEKEKNITSALYKLNRFESMMKTKVAIIRTPKIKNSTLGNSFIVGDFFLNSLPSETYQFIEADPPYGINLHRMRSADNKEIIKEEYVEIDTEHYPEFQKKLCKECYKLAAKSAYMILWCGPQFLHTGIEALKSAGFYPCIIPAIWKKGTQPGQVFTPDTNLGNSYEMFIYARKGDAKLAIRGRSNIFDFSGPVPGIESKVHSTERTVELMKEILRVFVWPGSNVLVPFAGSGNTLIAAYEMKHKAVGFDLSGYFKEQFLRRVIEREKK